MTTVINLTPHAISTADADGNIVATYPPSGVVARCAPPKAVDTVVKIDGISVVDVPATPGPVVDLPDPVAGTFLVVSAMVANHPDVVGRPDVLAPGTGPDDNAVRNEKGHIVAVRRFRRTV